jgi:hypothetical protein
MAQNIQTFAGDVVVPGTLRANLVTIEDPILTLGSNNYVDKASNTGFIINRFDSNANVAFYFDETNEQLRLAYTDSVGTDKNIIVDEETDLEINVFGYVSAYGFRGDGGLLSNLVTDLQSVTEYGASSDQTLVLSNVTTALDATEGNVVVSGNVTASTFFGDGANLTGIAATLEEIIINGNVTANVMELQNATSLITTGKVGIANAAPQHDLSVGANLYVEDVGSNVLTVEGNISAHQITLGTIEITPGYGLENVTNISNISYQTLILSNSQTAFVSTGKAGIGIEPDAGDVGASGLHVDGHLRLGGAADNTDEESMDIKAAGALNVLANESDTDNTNTGLLLRAGGVNESNITMYGDLSTVDKQYMSFATRSEERMRIDRHGNVSIGHTAGNYMLDVAGDANCVSLSIQDLTINTIGLSVLYDVDNILENGNVTTNVLTVGKVTVTDPTLAQTASNLVTWNATTKEFEDSGGLISNKLAIVSEQPPAALTGDSTVIDGHGRYKVTASSEGSINNHPSWQTFNKTNVKHGGSYSSGVSYATTSPYAHTGGMSLGGVTGEWVQLELPYKTKLRHISLQSRSDNVLNMPGAFSIIGSNDNTSWTTLGSFSGLTGDDYTGGVQKQFVVNATEQYKYYAIVVTNVVGNADDNGRLILGEWRLFTETFTVDAGVVSTTAASGLDVGYTEHPVEPMTDYHTYVEGHGTYEASASSEQAGNAWNMFDYVSTGGVAVSGMGWSDLYNADGTYQGSKYTADVGGTRYTGEWVQLKTPYAILLSHFKWFPVQNWEYRSPAQGKVLGSNDGQNWHKLTSWSGETFTFQTGSQIDVNATTPYQYFRLVIENTGTSSDFTQWRASAMEWRLFAEKPVTRMENVHISGDLSSETLQTGYIKWPKVPLKAAESEGYKVQYSSKFAGKEPYKAFNNSTQIGDDAWITGYNYTNGVANTGASDPQMNDIYGDWLELECPREFMVSYIQFYNRNDTNARSPKKGRFYGSNDGIIFTQLLAWSNLSIPNNSDATKLNINATNAYKIYRIQIEEIVSDGDHAAISELQLFEAATGVGAAPTSAKLQVAGSLGMAKGAEFFAGDDVVMELPKHDRPLTKYPEVSASDTNVTTTGLVQIWAGYTSTASSSGVNDGGRLAYDGIFNTVNPWISASGTYETTGGTATNSDSFESISGSFLKLKLPNKIRLSHVCMYNRDSASTKAPKNGIIWGSEDGGSTFSQIRTFSNLDPTRAVKHTLNINSTSRYDVLVVQITAMQVPGSGTYDQVAIQELEYYGYEEGDTSVDVVHRSIPNKPGQQHLEVYWDANDSNSYSFANSSNVYDLSGSGVTGTLESGVGFDAEYSAFTFPGGATDETIYNSSFSTSGGDYVHSVSMWFKAASLSSSFVDILYFFGTLATNEASFLKIDHTGIMWDTTNEKVTFPVTIATDQWYHLAMTYEGGGLKNCRVYLNGLGQTHDSSSTNTINIPTTSALYLALHINSTNKSFDGSIANFRLYSKALNADQVRELYEYDAERFGHRQNLVALHKGNLGVGVAHPTSRFEVAGADGLQEYPPKAMTGFETYMEGHGVFRASASTDAYAHTGFAVWKAFNKVQGNEGWHSGEGYTYNGSTSPSSYIANAGGSLFDTANVSRQIGGISGQWIKLECPQKIILKSITLQNRTLSTVQAPKDFTLLGSNNGGDWDILGSYVGVSSSTSGVNHEVNATESYKYFALVVTRVQMTISGDLVISEWRLFGTPAPSALEDGHLTLGKALSVPRVSAHAAGAETPWAESLVVHYDTTVDSVVSGSTVVDISGEGANGTLLTESGSGVTYNSEGRYFDFHGTGNTGDYVSASMSNPSGAWTFTLSTWFKMDELQSGLGSPTLTENRRSIFHIREDRNTSLTYAFAEVRNTYMVFYIGDGGSLNATDFAPKQNTWHHMVVSYGGSAGTAKVYIDNVDYTSYISWTTGVLNLAANETLNIGRDGRGNSYWDGGISNLKIWGGVALTAEEVAMEYALGRTGKAINVTDTALCLGGTAPRTQLDVRGSALFNGNVGIGTGSPYSKLSLKPTIIYNGETGSSFTANMGGLELCAANNDNARWNLVLEDNNDLYFLYTTTGTSGWGIGGYLRDNYNVANIDFTGQHRSFIDGVPYTEYDNLEGLIVSANKNKYYDINEDITTGANAIQISQSLPLVSLSTKEKDKACFGVISGSEDPESREYEQGTFVSVVQKQKGDRRAYVNSVGEGAMWVTNINGPLESGDYITTSNVAGYGQKQDSEFLANYTVAKITMDCDFNPQDQPIQRIKRSNVIETHYTGMVPVIRDVPYEFVTTEVTADDAWSNVVITPPDITHAEWSNLEANVQNTYTLTYTQTSNVVYDVKYTQTTTANVGAEDEWSNVIITPPDITYAEWSNLEANVQNTYTLTYTKTTTEERTEVDDPSLWNIVYYHMVEQEVDADYPDAVKHETVTERLENALDEHGQLQWEDDPSSATEKAYKIRYLDATGQQTDEANCVHRAAFVGCTYHCG